MTSKPTKEPGSRSAAYRAAIRLLEHRDRSIKDVTDRLTAKGYDEDVVAETVEKLQSDGFLNDNRFAERYVETSRSSRGHGSTRLKLDLIRKGISADLATEAARPEPGQEIEIAVALAERRLARLPADLPREAALRRVAGFLGRKGFGPEVVWAAAKQALDARR